MTIMMEKDASRTGLAVGRLHETLKDQTVAVLCDAFHDYPPHAVWRELGEAAR